MTTNTYLRKVLEREELTSDSVELEALREERKKIEDIIQEAFSECNPTIRYGGSKAKETMVKSSYDLDIVVYFESGDTKCGSTLEEIYENVKQVLLRDYFIVPKNTSLHLESFSNNKENHIYSHIDVVPGRRVSTDSNNMDVYLHQNTGQKLRLKTNIQKHIKHISESGLREEIKLAKIWRNNNQLNIKTFLLELLVIKVLNGRLNFSLEENMIYLWEQFSDKIDSIVIEDPANPNGNDLSGLLDNSKNTIKNGASNALFYAKNDSWEVILGKVINEDEVANAAKSISTSFSTRTFSPSSPYAEKR